MDSAAWNRNGKLESDVDDLVSRLKAESIVALDADCAQLTALTQQLSDTDVMIKKIEENGEGMETPAVSGVSALPLDPNVAQTLSRMLTQQQALQDVQTEMSMKIDRLAEQVGRLMGAMDSQSGTPADKGLNVVT